MIKKWCLLSSFLFCAACATFTSPQDEEEAKYHLQIGTSQLTNGNFPQALNELLIAEGLDPNNPTIQNNLGLAYFFRERVDLAEIHIRKAIKLNPKYSDAHNNLARVLIERTKYQEAIQSAQVAMQDLTYPNPERPLINLGIAQFKMKQYAKSKRTFQKALDYQRDNCLAQSFYGRSLFELQQFKNAAESLDRAASFCQQSQYDEPQYYSALSYYEIGQTQKAESRLEGLLKLYPQGKYFEKAKSMLETIRR